MTGKRKGGNAVALSDIATGILDPVLRKRAGISIALVQSWDEIVGERLAAASRPEKIAWPRRASDDDAFEPATLVIACEGMTALHIQHQALEIVDRVNGFLGYPAVARIKLVQKPVSRPGRAVARPAPTLNGPQQARLSLMTSGVEDAALRASLEALGRSVLGSQARKGGG